MSQEIAFEMATSSIRFGHRVTREIGMDLADLRIRRVMVLTDPNLVDLPPVTKTLESLSDHQIAFSVYVRVRIEPSDESFQDAIAFATAGNFEGFVAVGGGSTMDTAKVASLYSSYPADLLEYVN